MISPSNFTPKISTPEKPEEIKFQSNQDKKDELKFFGVSEYYIKEISEELITKFGNYFLKTFDQKNLDIPPSDFMSRHKINPTIRAKMVNWMIEVFHSFKSNEETIFSAVKIMDKFIWKSKDIIKSEDIHLIGIVCIYLASKTYDMNPIQMNNLIHLVGHDIFEQKIIKEMWTLSKIRSAQIKIDKNAFNNEKKMKIIYRFLLFFPMHLFNQKQ